MYQISTCYRVNSFLKKCIQFLIIVRSIQINEREKEERGKKRKEKRRGSLIDNIKLMNRNVAAI